MQDPLLMNCCYRCKSYGCYTGETVTLKCRRKDKEYPVFVPTMCSRTKKKVDPAWCCPSYEHSAQYLRIADNYGREGMEKVINAIKIPEE